MSGERKNNLLTVAILVLLVYLIALADIRPAAALHLTNRSVKVSVATPSVLSGETFQFFVPSTSSLGSIAFEYCSNSPLLDQSCTPPAGLDVTGASLDSQTGNIGFSVDAADTTASRLVINRAAVNSAAINTSYIFSGIMNPSVGGDTTYVRITTYPTTDATGAYTDYGAVAFATEYIFNVGAAVPPFVKICVGISVSPNCDSVSGDTVNLGTLSASQANAGQSQFSAGTNSATGYSVYSLGTTMTSGNNTIKALISPTTNFPGTQQFGINLRANLSPPVGQEPLGLGNAAPTANYNTPNRYMFQNGDMLVSAGSPSDYNRMTVSYLVNRPSGQEPGVYTTTVTYLAVGQF